MGVRTPKLILGRWGLGFVIVAVLALGLLYAATAWRPSSADYPVQGVEAGDVEGDVDWAKVRASGAQFAYLSATRGADGRDTRFADYWEASRAAGLKRGALHDFTLCQLARDQATNFIAVVPREADELSPAIDFDLHETCKARPSRSVLLGEVATFIKMVEAHSEKPVILRVSSAFDTEYKLSRAVDRPLWLTSAYLTPSYGERPWVMWRANPRRSVDGMDLATAWSVVRP
jgi:lysozyme